MLDILVRGGQLVTGTDVFRANLGIKDGKIVSILAAGERLPEANETIEATGKVVIPGVIDPHVHYRTFVSHHTDTAESTSISAAFGGVTTLLAMVGAGRPGDPIKEHPFYRHIETKGVRVKKEFGKLVEENEKNSVVDFGIHWILYPDEALIRQIPDAVEMGITSFKMFFGHLPVQGWMLDDSLVLTAMELIAASGGIAQIHAENGHIIAHMKRKLEAKPRRYTPEDFLKSRPNMAEAETVYRLAVLAEVARCPLYVVHLSTKEGLENVVRFKTAGQDITAETCPQYLLLNYKDIARGGEYPYTVAPALRTAEDNEALWRGIRLGMIETVGSDHVALNREAQKLMSAGGFFVARGIPGIETMLPLIFSEGVVKGRITLPQMVKVMCENPAKKFGLFPRKGNIGIGADADLVVIDPKVKWKIKAEKLHSLAGRTPYEDWPITGKPVISLLRGKILLKDGKLHQVRGFGRYLHAQPLS